MAEPFLGEIRAFGFNFAPIGWALCNGQLLPISQNAALFSLLGTFYGGDGRTTFGLPNLQGRVLIHQGHGLGLPNYVIGEIGGNTNVTLTTQQLPSHNHRVTAVAAPGSASDPSGAFIAEHGSGKEAATLFAHSATSPVQMAPTMIGDTGGSQPVSIQNPYVVINYCIALQGIYPSRN
ncbi:MAG TPA: tail fiber protein [Methylocella sp.]|nr:tail fiber protein [Methylocella sp.]